LPGTWGISNARATVKADELLSALGRGGCHVIGCADVTQFLTESKSFQPVSYITSSSPLAFGEVFSASFARHIGFNERAGARNTCAWLTPALV